MEGYVIVRRPVPGAPSRPLHDNLADALADIREKRRREPDAIFELVRVDQDGTTGRILDRDIPLPVVNDALNAEGIEQ